MLAGIWGSGNGTNTFGENVGTIGVTKVIILYVSLTKKYVCGRNLSNRINL